MKERFIPKGAVVALGVAASIASGALFMEKNDGDIRGKFLNQNTALLEQSDTFRIVPREGSPKTFHGTFTGLADEVDYQAVGSSYNDSCQVDFFFPNGEQLTIIDEGFIPRRILSVSPAYIRYYTLHPYTLEFKRYDRELKVNQVESVVMVPYGYGTPPPKCS